MFAILTAVVFFIANLLGSSATGTSVRWEDGSGTITLEMVTQVDVIEGGKTVERDIDCWLDLRMRHEGTWTSEFNCEILGQ